MSTVMQPRSDLPGDPLTIAGVEYRSRLLVGTGKYKDLDETRDATEASGAEIVTVAIRRSNIGQNPDEPNLLDVIPPDRYTLLPNTAGCYTAEDAVRTCRLARELLDGHDLVKLEVLGDQTTLFPDITETLKATGILVKDGFTIMVYTNDDPIIARRFEDMGCVAVMRRRRHRLGCRDCHGAGLRRRADEHGHRRRPGPRAHGFGDEEGHRGRPRGLPRRSYPAQALRQRLIAA
jgi:thiazole synthase